MKYIIYFFKKIRNGDNFANFYEYHWGIKISFNWKKKKKWILKITPEIILELVFWHITKSLLLFVGTFHPGFTWFRLFCWIKVDYFWISKLFCCSKTDEFLLINKTEVFFSKNPSKDKGKKAETSSKYQKSDKHFEWPYMCRTIH